MRLRKVCFPFAILGCLAAADAQAVNWKSKSLKESEVASRFGNSVLLRVVGTPRSIFVSWIPPTNIAFRKISGKKALMAKTATGWAIELDARDLDDRRLRSYLWDIVSQGYFDRGEDLSHATEIRMGGKGILLCGQRSFRDGVCAKLEKLGGGRFQLLRR